MSFSSMVFSSDWMCANVRKVHKGCREVVSTYAANCGITAPTLFDVLICGNVENATPLRHKSTVAMWNSAIKSEVMPHFSSLGIYNQPRIAQKEAILKFLWDAKDEDFFNAIFASKPSVDDLNAISEAMRTPTALLALKFFYLYLSHMDKKAYPRVAYTGAPAMTEPARDACIWLFGAGKSGAEAAKLHADLAKEVDRSQLYVNTVLYWLGS